MIIITDYQAGYHHPLLFQPGTSWEYGAGLDWAGRLVSLYLTIFSFYY